LRSYLLGLGDESALQVLDFGGHFVGVGVGAVEVAEAVLVHGVLELVGHDLDAQLLLDELLLQAVVDLAELGHELRLR